MSELKSIPELKRERIGDTYLYECEHSSNKTHMPVVTMPVGDHSNILLCKHCWIHIKNIAIVELLSDLLKEKPPEEIEAMLQRLIESTQDKS